MPSAHEYFSEQFEKWERRGRGWQVFEQPVQPEPPFVPFTLRAMTDHPVVDDCCRPSFLGSLFRGLAAKAVPVVAEEPEAEPEPMLFSRDSLVEFQASLPAELDIARESFDQFFHNLALCREPIAFELLGTNQRVLAQFAASAADASTVRRQLSAHFPDVQFRQLEGALANAWETSDGDQKFAVEFGLEQEFMLPLATGKMDPFVGLVGAMAELQPGELALFQILWQPVQNPWAESIINSVTLPDGKPLFVNASELAGAAENKAAKPLYAAVVRIMGRAASHSRLEEIAYDMASSLRVFSNPQGNALIPLHNEDYPFEEHLGDVLRRQSRRSGMILNSDELAGFVHLPSSAVRSPVLQRDTGRTKAAPAIVQQPPGVVIGDNEHNGETVSVFLTPDQRVRHTHIIGSNGTGKSSLLLNLIRQDIENGDGLAVLDPHGDLIEQILGFIPENRINDVVLVDPSDIEFPIGFNILQAHSEEEKRLIASDLVGVFRRLATSWGDQMDTVLQNAILVILESSRGGTLADLRRFLLEPPFRTAFLQSVQDPELIYYWQKVFPQLGGGKSVGSVLTRLQDFFSQKPLRNMVSQRQNKLDFADIMDSRKIFLAKLSEGLCGEENSYLLGTLLVSKFQQLAMARQAQKVAVRQDFWLYIDEFQHFITPSMAKILTGARKYRIGFTLAHQELHQLQSDAKVASAVMTQPCTRIVLRVGDDDAKKLGDGFESFDAKSLTRLEKFHAIVRVEQNDCDFNLALRKPEPLDGSNDHTAAIIAGSRAKYATPRAEVEATLLANLRPDVSNIKPPEPSHSDKPPSSRARQVAKPTSPAGTPAESLPPVPPSTAPRAEVKAILPANLRPDFSQTETPKPPDSDELLGRSGHPALLPKSPLATPEKSIPAVLLTVAPMPASPAPVIPKVSEPQQISEPAKAAEIPNAVLPPTPEIPKPTVSEIEIRPKDTAPATAESSDLGRGGSRHKSIQSRLKSEAQKLGFHTEVEKQLAKGSNDAADLLLRRGHIEIAVEITITTSVDHEFENVKKCLAAGMSRVAVIATGRKRLEEIASAVQGGLGSAAAAKVGYHTPDEFLAELQKLAKTAEAPPPSKPMAKTDKKLGFEINRNFPKLSPEEQRLTQQAIHEVMLKAIKS